MKLSLHVNLVTALRVLHGLVGAALVAGCIHLSVKLYEQFYLPYNLQDTPVAPTAAEAESPATRSLLRTADQLRARLATGTATQLPDVFWPGGVPTGTKP